MDGVEAVEARLKDLSAPKNKTLTYEGVLGKLRGGDPLYKLLTASVVNEELLQAWRPDWRNEAFSLWPDVAVAGAVPVAHAVPYPGGNL